MCSRWQLWATKLVKTSKVLIIRERFPHSYSRLKEVNSLLLKRNGIQISDNEKPYSEIKLSGVYFELFVSKKYLY